MLLEIGNELLEQRVSVLAVVREFTAYESSKYGVDAGNVTAISRGNWSAPRPIELEPGLARTARESRRPFRRGLGVLSVENPNGA